MEQTARWYARFVKRGFVVGGTSSSAVGSFAWRFTVTATLAFGLVCCAGLIELERVAFSADASDETGATGAAGSSASGGLDGSRSNSDFCRSSVICHQFDDGEAWPIRNAEVTADNGSVTIDDTETEPPSRPGVLRASTTAQRGSATLSEKASPLETGRFEFRAKVGPSETQRVIASLMLGQCRYSIGTTVLTRECTDPGSAAPIVDSYVFMPPVARSEWVLFDLVVQRGSSPDRVAIELRTGATLRIHESADAVPALPGSSTPTVLTLGLAGGEPGEILYDDVALRAAP